MTDLITTKQARLYLKLKDGEKDDDIGPIISAVSEFVRGRTGLKFDQRIYTEFHNGKGLRTLRVRETPVATSPAPTVTENGTALVVTTGYSDTADVVYDPGEGVFHRRTGSTFIGGTRTDIPGRWSPGAQNITIVYTGGYLPADMPADIMLVVKYALSFAWQHTDRKQVGVSAKSSGGGNITLLETLPKFYLNILDRHRVAYMWSS